MVVLIGGDIEIAALELIESFGRTRLLAVDGFDEFAWRHVPEFAESFDVAEGPFVLVFDSGVDVGCASVDEFRDFPVGDAAYSHLRSDGGAYRQREIADTNLVTSHSFIIARNCANTRDVNFLSSANPLSCTQLRHAVICIRSQLRAYCSHRSNTEHKRRQP